MDAVEQETQSTQPVTGPKNFDSQCHPETNSEAGALPSVAVSEPTAKQSLWQRMRSQPRETAAVVVLVVTVAIWLDSGSNPHIQESSDPMDGFDAILSDFDSVQSNEDAREPAEPVDSFSQNSFVNSELFISPSQPSSDSNSVTADYGDSRSFGQPSDSGYSGGFDDANSSTFRAGPSAASPEQDKSNSGQNRRVRFAGRIKPAN